MLKVKPYFFLCVKACPVANGGQEGDSMARDLPSGRKLARPLLRVDVRVPPPSGCPARLLSAPPPAPRITAHGPGCWGKGTREKGLACPFSRGNGDG